MDAPAGLTFRYADLLWILGAIPLAALFLFLRERVRQRRANRFASERLRGVSNQIRPVRPVLLTLGFLAGVVALAGPRHGFVVRPVEEPESNRVILLDASQSMAAEDVGTSRIDAAVAIAEKIVRAEQGRVALILFEGEAEVVSPLTTDQDAVVTLLESLEPGELIEPGSDFARALRRGIDVLPPGSGPSSELVLISDGEHRGEALDPAIEALTAAGIRVSTVLIGTAEGSTIPTRSGRPLRDDEGEAVITRARPDLLQKIAQRTGGRFFSNPFGAVILQRLTVSSGRSAEGARVEKVPLEQFQWPLAFALAMFFLGSIAHRGAEC